MSVRDDSVERLAEEVRAAVAQASAGATPSRPEHSGSQFGGFRRTLDRAAAFVTPEIPRGSRLESGKRAVLRALRFLWRGQTSYNALMLEAAGALADELDRARDVSRDEMAALERRAALAEARRIEVERRVATYDSRLAILEAGEARWSAEPSGVAGNVIPPGVYTAFEERFRGSADEIRSRQRDYVELLWGAPGTILDVGCGRGELLRLLEENGIPCRGVESNPVAVSLCRQQNLPVEQGEALPFLSSLDPGSLGAVVALQVVEHWTPGDLFAFLLAARRALSPGGRLLLETVNTDSVWALRSFFLDPTHVRPVPAGALQFLVEAAGFSETRVEYRTPLPESERLVEAGANEAKLNRLLFAPQDYVLVATVPESSGIGPSVDRSIG